jgi:hypothetical protein
LATSNATSTIIEEMPSILLVTVLCLKYTHNMRVLMAHASNPTIMKTHENIVYTIGGGSRVSINSVTLSIAQINVLTFTYFTAY